MDVDIRFSPAFALATITIPAGGEIKAEAGAMTAMSGGVEIETKVQGGIMSGLKRSVLGGESFFINTFRAPQGGELAVAPTLPGDIVHMPLDGAAPMMVQSGSWLASETASTWTPSGAAPRPSSRARGCSSSGARGPATCWCRATAPSSDRTLGAGRGLQDRHRPHRGVRGRHRLRGQQGGRLEVHDPVGGGPGRDLHGPRSAVDADTEPLGLRRVAHPAAAEAELLTAGSATPRSGAGPSLPTPSRTAPVGSRRAPPRRP